MRSIGKLHRDPITVGCYCFCVPKDRSIVCAKEVVVDLAHNASLLLNFFFDGSEKCLRMTAPA
jgi:hypothetical protein